MMDESVDKNGKMGGLWFCSVNLYTNILIIVSLELMIQTKYHTWINFVIILVITFVAYIIFLVIVHNLSMFNSVGTINIAFKSGRMWLNMIFVGGTCGIIDFFLLCVEFIFSPTLATKLEQLINQGVNLDVSNVEIMPKIIREKLTNYSEFKDMNQFEKIDNGKNRINIERNNSNSNAKEIKLNLSNEKKETNSNKNEQIIKEKNASFSKRNKHHKSIPYK